MAGFIVSFLVGALCIGIGISNMRGNISTLHSYHTQRVSEEDRLPFGKRVGLGTVIIGSTISMFSVLSSIAAYTNRDLLIAIGTVLMIIGLAVGTIITFAAIIKYNKGLF